MKPVPAIPEGYHSLQVSLTIKGAAAALDFYQRAFGAIENYRLTSDDGTVAHAEIRIGDCIVMISDEFPDWGSLSPETVGGCPSTLVLYVDDVDAVHARALEAGATEKMPVTDQFWGDRMGSVVDPYGYKWSVATHVEEVTPEEILARFKSWTDKGGC